MDPIVLRAVERVTSVLVGALSIYLGYRLFLALPTRTDGQGKVVLPGGISVLLSRVGPGVFFALFGTLVLVTSFYHRLEVGPTPSARATTPPPAGTVRYYAEATGELADAQAMEAARAEVFGDLLTLDAAADALERAKGGTARVDPELAADARLALPRVKRRVIFTVWDPDWGEFAAFARWTKNGGPIPAKAERPVRAWRHPASSAEASR